MSVSYFCKKSSNDDGIKSKDEDLTGAISCLIVSIMRKDREYVLDFVLVNGGNFSSLIFLKLKRVNQRRVSNQT